VGTALPEPVKPEVGRPYYRATTNLDVLALVEADPAPDGPEAGSKCFSMVEAAGVEPASESTSPRDSTCVSALEASPGAWKSGQKPRRASPGEVSPRGPGAPPRSQPAGWRPFPARRPCREGRRC